VVVPLFLCRFLDDYKFVVPFNTESLHFIRFVVEFYEISFVALVVFAIECHGVEQDIAFWAQQLSDAIMKNFKQKLGMAVS
jgi:hypothetical protein